MANSDGVLVQSVARALEILELFRQRKELGISEISSAMGLSKSTVYGLVNTLVTFGYLEQISENRKYKLGIHLFELGSAVVERLDLRQEARRYCEELSKRYGQTVHLATHWEGEVAGVGKCHIPQRKAPPLINNFKHRVNVRITQHKKTFGILNNMAVLLKHRNAEAVKSIYITGVIVAC